MNVLVSCIQFKHGRELNPIKTGIVIIWSFFDEILINVPSSAQCRKGRVKFSCDLGRAGLARVLPFETTDADYPRVQDERRERLRLVS